MIVITTATMMIIRLWSLLVSVSVSEHVLSREFPEHVVPLEQEECHDQGSDLRVWCGTPTDDASTPPDELTDLTPTSAQLPVCPKDHDISSLTEISRKTFSRRSGMTLEVFAYLLRSATNVKLRGHFDDLFLFAMIACIYHT